MSTGRIGRVVVGLCALLGFACSDDKAAGPDVVASSFAPPASSCDAPEPPVVGGKGQVVGTGEATSCTEDALREALAEGGDITFNCGAEPVTIAVDVPLGLPRGPIPHQPVLVHWQQRHSAKRGKCAW